MKTGVSRVLWLKSDNSVNSIHYKSTPDSLEQIAEQKAIKEKYEATLKRDWREDVQQPVKFKDYLPPFLETLEEFESMSEEHLGRINVAKQQINLLDDHVKPVHSAPYRARPAVRKFAAAEMARMMTDKVD